MRLYKDQWRSWALVQGHLPTKNKVGYNSLFSHPKTLTQVVDSKVGLKTICCLGIWTHHHSCIVDQNMELLFLCGEQSKRSVASKAFSIHLWLSQEFPWVFICAYSLLGKGIAYLSPVFQDKALAQKSVTIPTQTCLCDMDSPLSLSF